MVGSAIVRHLISTGHPIESIVIRNRAELDLLDCGSVSRFFDLERPEEVYVAAAKVGGIYANNTYPAEFIYENLTVQLNIIHSAFKSGVRRLLFLGSSCIYPKHAEQPMKEDALLTGKLEQTNEPYAIAKIAGIKLCESYNRQYGESHGVDYRSVMPTNLYGRGDNYHPENSHVIPALIRRFHEAKLRSASEVTLWGSGKVRREFLYVDDLASACSFVMKLPVDQYRSETQEMRSHLNVGSGTDVTILELAQQIAEIVGFEGNIQIDESKPDGAPRKLMDSSRINRLGWRPRISLREGLRITYEHFVAHNQR
jgi:GDP-L-fucose synthase